MPKYKIKDLAEEISIRVDDPKTSGYEFFVGLEHYDSGKPIITRYGSTSKLDSSAKVFKSGDILIARRNVYLKRAGVVYFDGLTSGDSIVIRAKTDNIQKILPFVFNTTQFWDYETKHADGSMSKRLSPKNLLEFEVNLPSNDVELTKLSDLLWSMYDSMHSYEDVIAKSDELIKSQFIEMFGDPFKNPKYSKALFKSCSTDLTKGPFGSDMKKSLYVPKGEDTYKVYLQINAIQKDQTLGDYFISKEYFEQKMYKYEVKPSDYIITCDGTLGEMIKLREPMERGVISPSLMRVSLIESKINDRYFESLWKIYMLPQMESQSRNSCLLHLPSATVLGNLEVPLPPLEIQNRYAELINQIDKSKFEIEKSLNNLKKIYEKVLRDNF